MIVSLSQTLPCLSETFIRREEDAMRGCGEEVLAVAVFGAPEFRLPGGRLSRATAKAIRLHTQPFPSPALRLRERLRLLRHARRIDGLAALLRARPGAVLLAQFAFLPADVAACAALLAHSPFAVRVHAQDVFAQSPALLRARLASARWILPCSELAASAVREAGLPAERIRVVRHGLDLGDPRLAFRPENPAEDSLVGVGRLVPKKGVDVLLRALALSHGPRRLTWIGDGPELEPLRQLARSLGLAESVRFAGALPNDETLARLRRANALVLPSRRLPNGDRDGIANVLAEAMALGVPVVTTTAGAAAELVADGTSGLLVEPDSPAALAKAIDSLRSAPPSFRARLVRNARATVEASMDASRNAAALLSTLRSIPTSGDTP